MADRLRRLAAPWLTVDDRLRYGAWAPSELHLAGFAYLVGLLVGWQVGVPAVRFAAAVAVAVSIPAVVAWRHYAGRRRRRRGLIR